MCPLEDELEEPWILCLSFSVCNPKFNLGYTCSIKYEVLYAVCISAYLN
jgi:hypothetical protein